MAGAGRERRRSSQSLYPVTRQRLRGNACCPTVLGSHRLARGSRIPNAQGRGRRAGPYCDSGEMRGKRASRDCAAARVPPCGGRCICRAKPRRLGGSQGVAAGRHARAPCRRRHPLAPARRRRGAAGRHARASAGLGALRGLQGRLRGHPFTPPSSAAHPPRSPHGQGRPNAASRRIQLNRQHRGRGRCTRKRRSTT